MKSLFGFIFALFLALGVYCFYQTHHIRNLNVKTYDLERQLQKQQQDHEKELANAIKRVGTQKDRECEEKEARLKVKIDSMHVEVEKEKIRLSNEYLRTKERLIQLYEHQLQRSSFANEPKQGKYDPALTEGTGVNWPRLLKQSPPPGSPLVSTDYPGEKYAAILVLLAIILCPFFGALFLRFWKGREIPGSVFR